MQRPDVSLIISTYQMPAHLRRVLASVARQTVVDRLEIIVSDDGSTDETAQVVAEFAHRVNKPIGFLTRPHTGFHLTRCRNDGARIASAPYLLFLDGDCLLPADHVEQYLRCRRRAYAHFGYCVRLEREVSARIQEPAIASGEFVQWAPRAELNKLHRLHYKALFYQWLGHATKPVLKGGNIGIWRNDFERVNGFDENFRAWGCEDDDLSHRLRAAGTRIASILGATRTYHLWHPPASTKPMAKWSEGPNVSYLQRPGRLTCCLNGLRKRRLDDLRALVQGTAEQCSVVQQHLQRSNASQEAELEILFYPGAKGFTSQAQCRVLIANQPACVPEALRRRAHVIVQAGPDMWSELFHGLHGVSAVESQAQRTAA